ncbi:MAG: XRE family transcriptional regulator [Microcystis sp. M015S2]|uniref:XRE family transcriptional regulator n=1 Tax=unclassified Microcystis TaxID=2643300 RepID=UPI002582F220|nr:MULTISPECIES: XRE family transcriptional regulator [unclassified Microcystis]MCA2712044.1 XRE family transcriptional regulator [Microcystis sp. M025S2]MCA2744758.1 XRE family transcriptional regulator [Microcystis sp. M015S2]MCA2759138.1 XRE family transcriptional regulator [Microcystis sp. M145S2]
MTNNILDRINPYDLGKRLKQAREQRGMTQEAAAKIIEVARTTLVAIEKGERRLKSSELVNLARAYGKSVSDFLVLTPPIESFEVQFRSASRRGEAEKTEVQSVILRFQEFCQNYLELEELMKSPLPRNYPPEYHLDDTFPINIIAESIANAERQRLGLGDKPISLLRDILEQEVGIRIFYLPMPSQSKCSEMYSYNETIGACIAINANHPRERQLWSLAHGYLHFLAHRYQPVIDYLDEYQRMPKSEQLAEAFPKYFLMPTSSLLKRYNDIKQSQGKFTPTHLITLAHYYGVSIQALCYRLEEMQLLPSDTYNRLKDSRFKIREAQQELGLENNPNKSYDLTPTHYQHLAIEAYNRELITEGAFAHFLGVDRLEARRLAEILREPSQELTEDYRDIDLTKIK